MAFRDDLDAGGDVVKVVCPDCGKEFEVETPMEKWRKENKEPIKEYQREYMRKRRQV